MSVESTEVEVQEVNITPEMMEEFFSEMGMETTLPEEPQLRQNITEQAANAVNAISPEAQKILQGFPQ